MSRGELPRGTVTLVFTDIEGSTRLLQQLGRDDYVAALTEHRRLLRDAFTAYGAAEVDTQGDSFLFAFDSPQAAVTAARAGQEALASHEWAAEPIRVRIGVHTGEPVEVDGLYAGLDVHRAARIMGAGHGGQVLISQTVRDFLDETFDVRDLGEHRLKDLSAPQRLYQVGEGDFPPLSSLNQTNLPVQPTPLVGRERELRQVIDLMRSARLLTLTGAGGSGKTRLALQAAADLAGEFKDGVWFVSLAAITDPELVSQTVSAALGARGDLAEFLRSRRTLLVLDNLEQLLPGVASAIADLLVAADVRVLATSREHLALAAEQEYPVPTLPLDEAVELFSARARQLKPTFERDEHVSMIAQRLDGLPLALELAAARVTVLTTRQIAERLGQSLELLTVGRSDAPARQRTLRAAVEWSHELLSAGERRLFAQLAVFVRSFDIDAAEAVCEARLDELQALVDKSLLRQTGEGRFFMLETLREFALEQLEELGEEEQLRRSHRAYFVALAKARARDLWGRQQSSAFAAIAPDHANLRAAVLHALEAEEPDDVGTVVDALTPFVITHGYMDEAMEWVERALRIDQVHSREGLLTAGGEIARFRGDLDRAVKLKEELLQLTDSDPERPRDSGTLADLCDIALDQGDFQRARAYAEQSLKAGGGARAAISFAELALREGDPNLAASFCVDALRELEEGEFNYACALEIRGEAARRLADGSAAASFFGEGLRLFAELGDGGGAADCLDGLGRLAAEAGDVECAGRLVGAAEQLRETWGRLPIRADLPPLRVPAAARAEGMSMTLEEAVAYASEDPAVSSHA